MGMIKWCPECGYKTKSKIQQICRTCSCWLKRVDEETGDPK